MAEAGNFVLGWLAPNCPSMPCTLRGGSSVSRGRWSESSGATLNGMRDDRALARAVVVVCCALLWCMQRCSGLARAGNPCN